MSNKGFRRNANALPPGQTRFVIGEIDGLNYWTSIAFDHENGKQTNESLLSMTDHELEKIVYGKMESRDFIRCELYRRGPDQDGPAGELYHAPHRALYILLFRRHRAQSENYAKLLKQGQMAMAAGNKS